MRSVTIPEPTFPTIYCQFTEQNDVLLSLMSSVVQRDVRSRRFDRNQERQVGVVTTPMTTCTTSLGLVKHPLTANDSNNSYSHSAAEDDADDATLVSNMSTRYHFPGGNFQSDIVIIVVLCKNNNNDCIKNSHTMDDDAFVESMIRIATNRGHAVIEMLSTSSLESNSFQLLFR
jgi:hypothetical protein